MAKEFPDRILAVIEREFGEGELIEHRRHSNYELPYEEGDLVFIKNQKKEKGKSFKLQKIWLGPYVVKRAKHPIYQMGGGKKEKWIHYDRLKKHSNDSDLKIDGGKSSDDNEENLSRETQQPLGTNKRRRQKMHKAEEKNRPRSREHSRN